jgi:hypothetical protein
MANLIELDDWITVGEMAKILGITRQGVHARIERGKFDTVYYITGENGHKIYLFSRKELVDTGVLPLLS